MGPPPKCTDKFEANDMDRKYLLKVLALVVGGLAAIVGILWLIWAYFAGMPPLWRSSRAPLLFVGAAGKAERISPSCFGARAWAFR